MKMYRICSWKDITCTGSEKLRQWVLHEWMKGGDDLPHTIVYESDKVNSKRSI